MKKYFTLLLCALSFLFVCPSSFAWGRHDVITQIALNSRDLTYLQKTRVTPEPIEKAAPDLLARVIPRIESWCVKYHHDHDQRYAWSPPQRLPGLDPRQALLWALEDNMTTPLSIPSDEKSGKLTAAEILIKHVSEPDGILDGGLDRPPYLARLRNQMSVFLGNDAHTHAFRHYYVPQSLLPPFLTPRGIAPYRAALYALLADGAFGTGHPYWGYRFLAWSIHYVQDVTQPWHTIFLPNISFLSFSKAQMKKEVSALHYLTEAFSDSWMLRQLQKTATFRAPAAIEPADPEPKSDPWAIAEITEELGRAAHAQASQVADLARSLFQPVVDQLNDQLKPRNAFIDFGGMHMQASMLDFSGNGEGATRFLMPVWTKSFKLAPARDRYMQALLTQLDAAIGGSRLVIARVLGNVIGAPPS